MSELNVADREELEESLALWKKRLAQSNTKISAARKAMDEARRAKQIAQARIERREKQIARLSARPGRRGAVTLALKYVGVTEHPAGSNRGPVVDKFQREFHVQGVPWCGCFVGYVAREMLVPVTDRIIYTPYIYEDATKSRNGLSHVVWRDKFQGTAAAHSADLVLFDFGSGHIQHVGMLVKPWTGRGPLQTVEGNTSFGPGGSQANGGAVARRARDISQVHSIVALRWP